MMQKRWTVPILLGLVLLSGLCLAADSVYRKPPQEVLDVLHAPPLPDPFLDPTRTTILLATPVYFPPIADLSQPFLRLAGTRVVVRNRSLYDSSYWTAFDLVKVADGSVVHVTLPAGAKAGAPEWSADGKRFAFSVITPDSVELWTGEAGKSGVRRIEGAKLNPFFGSEIQWMPDQKTLLVQTVPDGQGKAPAAPAVPAGPDVKETAGGRASSTYEVRDVLTSDHDEANLDYYGATQPAARPSRAIPRHPRARGGMARPGRAGSPRPARRRRSGRQLPSRLRGTRRAPHARGSRGVASPKAAVGSAAGAGVRC